MRIEAEELSAIISTITEFDRESELYLFGSRLDDAKRGGDIDILIKSNAISRRMLPQIEHELFKKIEEQKVDLVLTRKDQLSAFARMVLAQGAEKIW